MSQSESIGQCYLCEKSFKKRAMTRHIKSCLAKSDRFAGSQGGGSYHLIVQGRYHKQYWLHLLINKDATLDKLDQFLREIWLECCGHLSQFIIDGIHYDVDPFDDFSFYDMPEPQGMDVKIGSVVGEGTKFAHEYDFGSTTYLDLRVIAEHPFIYREPILLLARNDIPPAPTCEICEQQTATQVCTMCLYEGEGWCCDDCTSHHECGEEMFLPLVNSPRVGVCGYVG